MLRCTIAEIAPSARPETHMMSQIGFPFFPVLTNPARWRRSPDCGKLCRMIATAAFRARFLRRSTPRLARWPDEDAAAYAR